MEFLSDTPIWVTALLIFALRVVDVSLGTIRTIAVVHGRVRASVVLGFVEILIWVTAISSVIANLSRSPLLLVAYAGGFATGNATGILLERRLAWGNVIVRFLSTPAAQQIASYLRDKGHWAAVFQAAGPEDDHSLVFGTCPKSQLRAVIEEARRLDPEVVYSVEPVLESGAPSRPLPHATGWRSTFLRK